MVRLLHYHKLMALSEGLTLYRNLSEEVIKLLPTMAKQKGRMDDDGMHGYV